MPAFCQLQSGGTTSTPDPDQNFNRAFTDYFVNGRQDDIGAFDTPKNPGRAIGWFTQIGPNWLEIETTDAATMLHNGDGLCCWDLHKELVGLAVNRAEPASPTRLNRWRVSPRTSWAACASWARARM